MKTTGLISCALILALALPACGEKNGSPSQAQVPHPGESGVWTCPMCPSVLAAQPGKCPSCGMDLINTPTALVWTCTKHPIALREEAGTCPACNRPLRQVTMGLAWRCPEHDEEKGFRAGKCRRCQADLEEVFEPLPHGDHNPRHGGQFFMAPDQWHHLEGAYPEKGIFRLYLYDDFTRPLSAKAVSGHVEIPRGEAEPLVLPLRAVPGDEYLEARLEEKGQPPLDLTAILDFEKTRDRARFDFQFQKYSSEEPAAAVAIPAAARWLSKPASELSLTPAGLMREILARDARTRQAIEERRWEQIYLAALEAKDLALKLEERLAEIHLAEGVRSEDFAKEFDRALRRLIRGAWLLDLYGDQGDGGKVRRAYEEFSQGVEGLRRLIPPQEG